MRRLIKVLAAVAAVLIAGAAVSLVLCGCDPSYLDEGRMVRDGFELRPAGLPWSVVYDETVTEEIGADAVIDAVAWWQEQAGRDGIDRTWFVMGDEVPESDPWDGEILVTVAALPGSDDDDAMAAEVADLSWNDEGGIIFGTVTVNHAIAYDAPTARISLLHGFGHMMGLDDDPGPPETVDLRSIMASPMDPLGRLTDHDFELLIGEL
jgi:hypothetical protein